MFESLECRTLLTTTMFLDLGGGIGMGNTLSVDVDDFRDIFGGNTGATGVQLAKVATVFDDPASNRLVGSFSTDWFFFDPLKDKTPDRKNNEATN